jgi:hypothetical protein
LPNASDPATSEPSNNDFFITPPERKDRHRRQRRGDRPNPRRSAPCQSLFSECTYFIPPSRETQATIGDCSGHGSSIRTSPSSSRTWRWRAPADRHAARRMSSTLAANLGSSRVCVRRPSRSVDAEPADCGHRRALVGIASDCASGSRD